MLPDKDDNERRQSIPFEAETLHNERFRGVRFGYVRENERFDSLFFFLNNSISSSALRYLHYVAFM